MSPSNVVSQRHTFLVSAPWMSAMTRYFLEARPWIPSTDLSLFVLSINVYLYTNINKRVAAHDTQTLSTRIVYMNNVHKHLDRQPIRAGVQSRDGCAILRSRNGPRAISRWTESWKRAQHHYQSGPDWCKSLLPVRPGLVPVRVRTGTSPGHGGVAALRRPMSTPPIKK